MFYLKVSFHKYSKKLTNIWATLLSKGLSKMSQSGHTDCHHHCDHRRQQQCHRHHRRRTKQHHRLLKCQLSASAIAGS